jgi:hypothetical protein
MRLAVVGTPVAVKRSAVGRSTKVRTSLYYFSTVITYQQQSGLNFHRRTNIAIPTIHTILTLTARDINPLCIEHGGDMKMGLYQRPQGIRTTFEHHDE